MSDVADSKRPLIINWQLYHQVLEFVRKYADIPHVVLVGNVVEAEILQRDLDKWGRQSEIVSISAMYHSADWHKLMDWAFNMKGVLIFKSKSLATNGWRANWPMGMSCTYYLEGDDALQLKGRVTSSPDSIHRSPVLVAKPPQYEIL